MYPKLYPRIRKAPRNRGYFCYGAGEVAKKKVFSIDREKFEEESEYDGFYAVTTDLADDPGEIIRINKGRWEIEESFYVGAMEGKAVRALESTFGLVGSMTAFSKAQFRRLVARSKKEEI